jgi:hypothetical protein
MVVHGSVCANAHVPVDLAETMGRGRSDGMTDHKVCCESTRISSGPYGARTLSGAVHVVPCIKIGENIFTKKTSNVLRLFLGGPSRVPVNTSAA